MRCCISQLTAPKSPMPAGVGGEVRTRAQACGVRHLQQYGSACPVVLPTVTVSGAFTVHADTGGSRTYAGCHLSLCSVRAQGGLGSRPADPGVVASERVTACCCCETRRPVAGLPGGSDRAPKSRRHAAAEQPVWACPCPPHPQSSLILPPGCSTDHQSKLAPPTPRLSHFTTGPSGPPSGHGHFKAPCFHRSQQVPALAEREPLAPFCSW